MKNGFKLITNGTDNHLMLIDVKESLDIDGSVAEKALDKAGLTTNKNVIPDDKLPPFRPSGIRLGTPAVTTRGFKTEHMEKLATWISESLKNHDDDKKLDKIRIQVKEFSSNFPLPSDT